MGWGEGPVAVEGFAQGVTVAGGQGADDFVVVMSD